ncbi:MAG: GDP-mannose 4,6-dehydratase [Candidatus Pelagibacter sp. TMED273]|nr:MAG: GDP-mannose 4,6-dehydratase [Candidatus Pelagibacter sp. TMED273]|tara:strand:- start:364 stop:1404 length:1041 start_codon:yes stop_codon:yes gene_type:complete
MTKTALITGITGQTGSYLAKLLLNKKYKVYGIIRRTSSFHGSYRLEQLIDFDSLIGSRLNLVYGDLTDSNSVESIISKIKPDEIYNLAAQSHVKVSFELPVYTANVNALGALYILESIRKLRLNKKIKFYQASTSEMYGNSDSKKLDENSKLTPVSPYGTSKLFAYWTTINYRNAYNMFASNGILFNHESPLRGEHFVTKKITKGLIRILHNKQKVLELGNLNAIRDWGYAEDYANAIWKILQLSKPADIVICSDKSYSVREFIKECFTYMNIKVKFIGKGLNEKVIDNKGKIWIKINKKFIRENEIDQLIGNSSKAKKILKWKNKVNLKQLVKKMIEYELKGIKQ